MAARHSRIFLSRYKLTYLSVYQSVAPVPWYQFSNWLVHTGNGDNAYGVTELHAALLQHLLWQSEVAVWEPKILIKFPEIVPPSWGSQYLPFGKQRMISYHSPIIMNFCKWPNKSLLVAQ